MARFVRNSLVRRALFSLEKQGIDCSSLFSRNFATKGKVKSKSDKADSVMENVSKKDFALNQAIKKITKDFGKGSIIWLNRSNWSKLSSKDSRTTGLNRTELAGSVLNQSVSVVSLSEETLPHKLVDEQEQMIITAGLNQTGQAKYRYEPAGSVENQLGSIEPVEEEICVVSSSEEAIGTVSWSEQETLTCQLDQIERQFCDTHTTSLKEENHMATPGEAVPDELTHVKSQKRRKKTK